MPTIAVADEAVHDEATPVRVTGVEPGATVELLAETDGWYDEGCSSRTIFEADGEGLVDTAEHEPVEGYDGVAPMGWLWSMAPDGEGETGWPHAGRDPVTVEVETRVDGAQVAETTTVRRPTDPGVEHVAVDDDVVGDLFVPAGEGPHPGVLVLHGSEGEPARGRAALLAAHGFAALAVHYFGDPAPLPDQLIEVPVEYFGAAADRLRERADVADGPLGLYGHSKGAEAALVTASRYDWAGAVVAGAPAAHRWQGLDESGEQRTSSWTADGDPLPHVPFRAPPGSDEDGNVAFANVYANSLDRAPGDRREAARIPVERIDAALLVVSGGADRMWPSVEFAATVVEARSEEAGVDVDTAHRSYERAGHSIAPPYRPTAGTAVADGMALGGTPAANARAAADSWPAVLETLDAIEPSDG
ncbi:acyl-CoA thioesterase/BAAT N-terminal domain-containing protein [Halosimplex litoreum]|uniref:Acyl-CoA thioesterase/BAAT N-terminal domain-containing protein n=1 Tax=Halosimplex litoreum TaxID=1198301 RepID=A0A7U3WAX4_9EURY|nr:acyl-CoA thioesterase/bile acid-CoA:amino acid N-acyltransferase family protein [Halosimplex litoreum]QPV64769.1 acyl-CoA thioesterase/BAAT N-terminal domain-containing protein [Halosimplex litoreum]